MDVTIISFSLACGHFYLTFMSYFESRRNGIKTRRCYYNYGMAYLKWQRESPLGKGNKMITGIGVTLQEFKHKAASQLFFPLYGLIVTDLTDLTFSTGN